MDSALHELYSTLESVFGTTPANPVWVPRRYVDFSVGLSKTSLISDEARSDRQIADYQPGTRQGGGDVMTELSYGSHDDWIQAALMGTWAVRTAAYSSVTTISAAAADNSLNDSANAFPEFTVGEVITIAGFTGAAGNNGKVRVVSRTASKIVVSGITLVNDAAGEAVTLTSNTYDLTTGTTRRSYSLLRKFTDDASTPFHLVTGAEVATWKLALKADSKVSMTFTLMANDVGVGAASAPSGSTYGTKDTNATFNFAGGTITEGGSEIAVVTDFNITAENGHAPRFVIGQDTSLLPSIQRSNVTGQVVAFFENTTLLNKFLNSTASSLSLELVDRSDNRYVISLPEIYYTGGQPDTKGQGPVTLTLPFQAILDPVTGLKNVKVSYMPKLT